MIGRFLVLCCVCGFVGACVEEAKSTGPTTSPATTKSAEQKKPEPAVNEVVTVDLSKEDAAVRHCASGFVRGLSVKDPADEWLLPLKPNSFRQPAMDTPAKYGALAISPRARGMNARLFVVLSGGVGFDGTYPGEKGKWARWDAGVAQAVKQAAAAKLNVVWEIWDEPNAKEAWKGNRDQYHALWCRTVRRIRAIDPHAVIAGPSIDHWDGGWINGFLKVAKDYGAMPDIVAWHERDLRPDIAGHVRELENNEWQDGFPSAMKVAIGVVDPKLRNHPAAAALFIAAAERSKVDMAERQVVGESGTQVAGLLTVDYRPRAAWWVYKSYAEMIGRRVELNKSTTVEGLAARDAEQKTVQVILGRARTSMGTTQPAKPALLGQVELKLTHAGAHVGEVVAWRLPSSNGTSLAAPIERVRVNVTPKNQELKIVLPDFGDGDAYLVTISGLQSTTAPAK